VQAEMALRLYRVLTPVRVAPVSAAVRKRA
jgi:hypothetical protein